MSSSAKKGTPPARSSDRPTVAASKAPATLEQCAPVVFHHLGCLDLLTCALVSRSMRALVEVALTKRLSEFGIVSPCCMGRKCEHAINAMFSFPARKLCCECATNLCWSYGLRRRWSPLLPWFRMCRSCYTLRIPQRVELEGGAAIFKNKVFEELERSRVLLSNGEVLAPIAQLTFGLNGIGDLGGLEVVVTALCALLGGRIPEIPVRFRDAYAHLYPPSTDLWGRGDKFPEMMGLLSALESVLGRVASQKAVKQQQLVQVLSDLGQELIAVTSSTPIDNIIITSGSPSAVDKIG